MKRKVQDVAALIFIVMVAMLAVIAVLGVWEVFNHDVVQKSFETVGFLTVITIVILFAGHFIGDGGGLLIAAPPTGGVSAPAPAAESASVQAFVSIRNVTLGILIICSVLLAFVGVLGIWNFIANQDVLHRSLGSLAVLAFGAFVIVMTCLQREDNKILKNQNIGAGALIAGIVLLYLIFTFSGFF